MKKLLKFRVPFSTACEIVGFISLSLGIATFSIPISAIICGGLLIIVGGLTA
jgi:hypothetical protein